jgi:hypothetical protein
MTETIGIYIKRTDALINRAEKAVNEIDEFLKMNETVLNGRPAIKVNAKHVMWGATDKAMLYDIDGDQKWVPRKVSKFNKQEGTLLIEEWFYNKLFPKG